MENPDGAAQLEPQPDGPKGKWSIIKKYARSIGEGLFDHWKQATFGGIVTLALLLGKHMWVDGLGAFQRARHQLTDEEALRYAHLSDAGSTSIVTQQMYDPASGRQYVAVAYEDKGDMNSLKLRVLQVVKSEIVEIGSPLPVLAPNDGIPTNDHGAAAKHYFGFVDAREDNQWEVYALASDYSTGGRTLSISLMELPGGQIYTLEGAVNAQGLPRMHPKLSANVKPDAVRDWMLAKYHEFFELDKWNTLPLETLGNGLQRGASTKKTLAYYEHHWFELNGANATEGHLQSVPLPSELLSSEDARDSAMATCVADGTRWYSLFKGPVVYSVDENRPIQLAYVPDVNNFREVPGMILTPHFILFGMVVLDKRGESLVAVDRRTGEYVHLRFTSATPLTTWPKESAIDQNNPATSASSDTTGEPTMKDWTLDNLYLKNSELRATGTHDATLILEKTSTFDPSKELLSAVECPGALNKQ